MISVIQSHIITQENTNNCKDSYEFPICFGSTLYENEQGNYASLQLQYDKFIR